MTCAEGRRVVVTGVGAVTPLGEDAESSFRGLVAGRSGIRRIRRFDPSGFPVQIAAEVAEPDPSSIPGAPPIQELGFSTRLALAAAAEAMSSAELRVPRPPSRRFGAALAVGAGCYDNEEVVPAILAAGSSERYDSAAAVRTMRRSMRPFFVLRTGAGFGEGQIARCFGIAGSVLSCLTACAAGTQAVGEAFRAVRSGRAEIFLAGGAESLLYPIGLLGLCKLGALCTDSNDDPPRASRPFDATRSGFVIGEGAGMLVLETLDHAKHRGAPVRAEVLGYGCSGDAYRLTDSHPTGRGAAQAMATALADADLAASDIDYINAHGTSTPVNDLAEALAIEQVFGNRASRVPVSSFKSMIGHATVGAGAIELVGTILALRAGQLPPNRNLERQDPRIHLNIIRGAALAGDFRTAMSNSFGFGGQNASIVVRRFDD